MATLTWNLGIGPAWSAATTAQYFADLHTMIAANSGNAAFSWATSAVNSPAGYDYIVLYPKSASFPTPAPVILIISYTSGPATYNTDIFDTLPTANEVYICYFPVATTNTASNLLPAATGSSAIFGNDTNCVKASGNVITTSGYVSGWQLYYFDSADAVVVGMGNLATALNQIFYGAGICLSDFAGTPNLYTATFAFNSQVSGNNATLFSGGQVLGIAEPAGTPTYCIRTNYGAANSTTEDFWQIPSTVTTSWLLQSFGVAADIMADSPTGVVYFTPILISGPSQGGGAALKLRQIAFGPPALINAAFHTISTAGGIQAIHAYNTTITPLNLISPWFINFVI